MKKPPFTALLVGIVIIGVLAVVDSVVKADNAQRLQSAEARTIYTGRQIETTLAKVISASSRNASALASARTLQNEYSKVPQTSAGINAFRAVFARLKPQIIRPLVGRLRSYMATQFFELTTSANMHADALSAKENIEKNEQGGLIIKFQRDLGLIDSP